LCLVPVIDRPDDQKQQTSDHYSCGLLAESSGEEQVGDYETGIYGKACSQGYGGTVYFTFDVLARLIYEIQTERKLAERRDKQIHNQE
jgi:hypothetical protein